MQTLARFSEDNGASWSEPIDLTPIARDMNDDGWRASVVGPGGAIQVRSGRLLAPIWKSPYNVFVARLEGSGLLEPGHFDAGLVAQADRRLDQHPAGLALTPLGDRPVIAVPGRLLRRRHQAQVTGRMIRAHTALREAHRTAVDS